MKTTYQLIQILTGVLLLALSAAVNADASCKDWSAATVDPTKGKYPIVLRICDLTYGLSAYVEIKNQSSSRLALAYRITTNDDKQRDVTELVLEPSITTRAENCQACASRHAGFKSWEILSVSEAIDDNKSGSAATAAPLPAFMGQPGSGSAKVPSGQVPTVKAAAAAPEKREVAQPSPGKPVAEKTMTEKPLTAAPAVAAEPPKAAAVEPAKAVVAEPAAVTAPESESEGFRAEDGTIIPWEQLPPEFRPRK